MIRTALGATPGVTVGLTTVRRFPASNKRTLKEILLIVRQNSGCFLPWLR
jgi:hypothetical protein